MYQKTSRFNEFGFEASKAVIGGGYVPNPVVEPCQTDVFALEVESEYTGTNHRQLAEKYNLSITALFKLINLARSLRPPESARKSAPASHEPTPGISASSCLVRSGRHIVLTIRIPACWGSWKKLLRSTSVYRFVTRTRSARQSADNDHITADTLDQVLATSPAKPGAGEALSSFDDCSAGKYRSDRD